MRLRHIPVIGLVIVSLCATACLPTSWRGSVTAAPAPPVDTAESHAPDVSHDELYSLGLAAFREFTPEGYVRAANHFGRALAQSKNCEYALHLAQAHLFLAMEQEANREPFDTSLGRATLHDCGGDSDFRLRLEALQSFAARDREVREAAFDRIERAVQLDAREPLNLWALRKLGVPDRGEEVLSAAALSPDLALVRYEIGRHWLQRRRFADAKSSFERAIQLSPRHFRSYVGLAEAIHGLDEFEEVGHLIRRAVDIAPSFLDGRLVLGNYFTASAEIELAEEQYLAALALKPDFETAYLRLAFAYLQAERIDDAETAARNALAVNPFSYEAYYYLGNVWYERGKLRRAREEYEQALKLAFAYPEASYGLGAVLFEQDEDEQALEQFDKVLYYVPNHANAYFSRGLIWFERGRLPEATADFTHALTYYGLELDQITTTIAKAEARGMIRKAAFERTKKERLDVVIQRVTALREKAEAGR